MAANGSAPYRAQGLTGILVAAIGIGVLLRIILLANRELWYDEVLSILFAAGQKLNYEPPPDVPIPLAQYFPLLSLPQEKHLQDMLQTLKRVLQGVVSVEPHPPLFYLSLHGWLRLWGNGEAAVRSLNALMSVGAIAAAYGWGRAIATPRTGLALAALMALNPFFFFHSLNVRMYCPLVFWVVVSGWAVQAALTAPTARRFWAWSGGVVVAAVAGLLTSYLFLYWLMACLVLAVVQQPRRFWQPLVWLGAIALLCLPWLLWGLRQQLRNADLDRFAVATNLGTILDRLGGCLQTLGIHLLWGDWGNALPEAGLLATGMLVLGGLGWGLVWRYRHAPQTWVFGLIWGVLPLGLALAADLATGKSTLSWGLGRSVIYALPGLLLLVVLIFQAFPRPWQGIGLGTLLGIYLTLGLSDFALRPRLVFHQLAAIAQQTPATPTLLLLNSKAWGHVLRAAYYLPPTQPIDLLAAHPVDLPGATAQVLNDPGNPYERVLWLNADRPVWQEPDSDAQKQALQAEIQAILETRYGLTKTIPLQGTMDLDRFLVGDYRQR